MNKALLKRKHYELLLAVCTFCTPSFNDVIPTTNMPKHISTIYVCILHTHEWKTSLSKNHGMYMCTPVSVYCVSQKAIVLLKRNVALAHTS